jgi:gluconokinase
MVIVVMGVSGSGKTTIGRRLAGWLGQPFVEGDDFHAPEDLKAMAQGHPLDDERRAAWIQRLGDHLAAQVAAGASPVAACSALRRRHRDQLARRVGSICWVDLEVPVEVLRRRLAVRVESHGGVGPSLLESQLRDLEPPAADEPRVVRVDADRPVSEVVDDLVGRLSSSN